MVNDFIAPSGAMKQNSKTSYNKCCSNDSQKLYFRVPAYPIREKKTVESVAMPSLIDILMCTNAEEWGFCPLMSLRDTLK